MKELFKQLCKFVALCIAAGLGLGLAMILLMSIIAGWLLIIGAI